MRNGDAMEGCLLDNFRRRGKGGVFFRKRGFVVIFIRDTGGSRMYKVVPSRSINAERLIIYSLTRPKNNRRRVFFPRSASIYISE